MSIHNAKEGEELVLTKRFRIIKGRLGRGGFGTAAKVRDEATGEYFACKEYKLAHPVQERDFFDYFIREARLLYRLHHKNVVQVFSSYIYPDARKGYIMMEYVKGTDIEAYLEHNPEHINEIFVQAISGFAYLSRCGVVHRDIRSRNILVSDKGQVKIIDFGFGKQIGALADSEHSVCDMDFNWPYGSPPEFADGLYDFKTEMYCLGSLFRKIMKKYLIDGFKHQDILGEMCTWEPEGRPKSFSSIYRRLRQKDSGARPSEAAAKSEFSVSEKKTYHNFADGLKALLHSIDKNCQHRKDANSIQEKLEKIYRDHQGEKYVSDQSAVVRCFFRSGRCVLTRKRFSVRNLGDFLKLARSCPQKKKGVLMDKITRRLKPASRSSL